jgi:hypothetical protein
MQVDNTGDYDLSATYEWFRNGASIGVTNSFYTTNQIGIYTVKVTDGSCDGVSNALTITTGPLGLSVNSTAPLGKVVCGTLADTYRVTVTVGDCSAVSNTVDITPSVDAVVNPLIAATNGGNLCDSANVMLYVSNDTVFTNPQYRWYHDTNPIPVSTGVSCVTTDTGNYYVVVMEGSCTGTSATYHVSGNPSTYAVDIPTIAATNNGELCAGANVMLHVTEEYDATTTYQWFFNEQPIVGATDPYLQVEDTGYYRVEVKIDECSSVSNLIHVYNLGNTLTDVAPILKATNEGDLCDGANMLISVVNFATYPFDAVYTWYHNGDTLVGEESHSIVVTNSGWYFVEVSIGDCSVTSAPQIVEGSDDTFSDPLPEIASTGGIILCEGGTIRLIVTNTDQYPAGAAYQWYREDIELSGENNEWLILPKLITVPSLFHRKYKVIRRVIVAAFSWK